MVDMILEDFMQDHTDAYYQDGVLHPYAMEGDSNGSAVRTTSVTC